MTKRWTAYKMEIKDIINGTYSEDGFIKYGNLQVNRVRIMGTIVSKYENYNFLVLDDGTETIRIKAFEDNNGLIKKVNVGEIIDVIGRVKKYQDEIYIVPEIIKKITDPNFWILRKLELIKLKKIIDKKENEKSKENEEFINEEVVEEEIEESPRQKIIKLISEIDKGEGAEIDELISKSGYDKEFVENILTDLMNDGEIFEPRSGKIKLL